MKYFIGFRNLKEAHQKRFTKTFRENGDIQKLCEKLNCRLLKDIDGDYTYLTIVGNYTIK
mgnify:CR=1 FL=1